MQIRPLMWFLTPFKKVEGYTNKTFKYYFLCFELIIYKKTP